MSGSDVTVFTIADQAFLPGLAGLVNSLRAARFTGAIVVGSPTPIAELEGVENVRTVMLPPDGSWVGAWKAHLLLHEGGERFVFFDADIVLGDLEGFERVLELADTAPVLALEGLVSPSDPRRLRWAARLGLSRPTRDAWSYFNSGFLAGRLPRDRPLLQSWAEGIRAAGLRGGHFADADFPFADQDVLNALLQQRDDVVVSLQFPDWWSGVAPLNPFLHVGGLARTMFYHSVGVKPWNLNTVPLRDPNAYEVRWFQHAVVAPTPVCVPCSVPPGVRSWLADTTAGRIASRGRRIRQRLAGR